MTGAATRANPQTADETSLLRQIVDALCAAGQPDRIILFGSRARGDARPDSDFDFLIVQPAQPGGSRWQELQCLRQALRRFPIAKDLLLFRPVEFDYWRESLNHIVGRSLREGRLLYERS
jgi:predicted nucleotidyltransferase